IEDAAGDVIWSYDNPNVVNTTPILDDGLAYLVNDILADRAARADVLGAGNPTEANRPAAVVSGWAGGDSGAWTIGYSPNLAVGVWVGRTDGASVSLDPRALSGAAPLWRAITDYSGDRFVLSPDAWPQPENIVDATVCERSGLRLNEACPQRNEIFLENTQPPETDTYWQRVAVNTQTNQLATANTPSNFREERQFFVPPAEAEEWWRATQPNVAILPETFDTITRPDVVSASVILRPDVFDYVRGQVDIRGSMDGESLQYYQLAYGQGLNPNEWIDIGGQQTDYVPGQSLGTWDTTGLDGLYNLRLTAIMTDNSIDPYIVQVTVDNTPPTIELAAGAPGQVFTFLDNNVIPLQAITADNVAIDRVEFYHNGDFVGVDEAFPYGYDHDILRTGEEQFRAVVFDAAGNTASAEVTVEVARGGT
ncbi:MAG: Ig-like domain-containing protein, partial [Chloroflexota bacterium]